MVMDHFQHEPAAVTGEVVSSVPRSEPPPARVGVPVVGRLPLALAAGATLLIACISMVGAARPGIYARETPNWAAQAVGQDWMDLLVAVPWLTITARASARGSRRGLLLLAAGLAY